MPAPLIAAALFVQSCGTKNTAKPHRLNIIPTDRICAYNCGIVMVSWTYTYFIVPRACMHMDAMYRSASEYDDGSFVIVDCGI